jgi:hypothetical protein
VREMYLGNPLLPINITAASAAESIKKKLAQKNWHEYEQKPLLLNLVPYFLFNYHYFIESDTKEHRIVKRSLDGILVIDGHDIEIREDLVELIKNNWKKSIPEVPRGAFDEKWCNIEKKDVEEVLKVKTAEHFEVPKSNVVISSAKKLFLPIYKTSVVMGGKEYKLIVNAIDGNIDGLKEMPEREKSYSEIIAETVGELKDPRNWIKYSVEAVTVGTNSVATKTKKIVHNGANHEATNGKTSSINLAFVHSKWFLILLVLLGLFLIYIGLFKIRPI